MTQADPFAAASVAGTTTAPAPDAFTSSGAVDDPFATSSTYMGGDFTPSPGLEVLQGRVVVMIPRAFNPAAKDPNNPDKTRELYTVDLTVLTGGRLAYYYKQRADAEKGTPEELKEYVVDEVSPDSPFTVTGYWVPQGAVIGKLKQAHREGRPYLGCPAMIPVKADRDKGRTAAQVREEYARWVAAGKPGARPRYTWVLDDPTPEQRAIAVAWWVANRDKIPTIATS